MKNDLFNSENNFKKAFEQGLHQLLTEDSSVASFILVLANYYQHSHLYSANQPLLEARFKHYSSLEMLDDSVTDDDRNVINKIISTGLTHLVPPITHSVCDQHYQWLVSFNTLRSFRPERMSNQHLTSIEQTFESKKFHFDKTFLQKEMFIETSFNGKTISLFYNKFPFAEYLGLLVIDRQQHLKQFLTESVLKYVIEFYHSVQSSITNMVIAYNSLGAGASVNHLHFQSCILQEKLPITEEIWQHNGGSKAYPADCTVLNSLNAWPHIHQLQCNNTPFNLIFTDQNIFCVQRKLNSKQSDILKQVGWIEVAGFFSIGDYDNYLQLTAEEINSTLINHSR